MIDVVSQNFGDVVRPMSGDLRELTQNGRLANVLCGGDLSSGQWLDEQYFLDLERAVFVELAEQPKTHERIKYMLETGKPLRN